MRQAAAHDDEETDIKGILDRLQKTGEESDGKVTINEVLTTFQHRSMGVLITMLGLLAALPIIGAVPGLPMVVSIMILVVIANGLFGLGVLRVPGRLGRTGVSHEEFVKAMQRGRRWTRWIDQLLGHRLTLLTKGPIARSAIYLTVAAMSVIMFPLELVPWGVTAPAFGIVAFGLALIAGDGLFALVGYAFVAATLATVLAVV